MTTLGPDWIPDAEGIPHRQAGRAVIFSPAGQVLLLHGHDGHKPEQQWWFTVGGGKEPDETIEDCVIREVFEEIGLQLTRQDLVGPVLYREAEFHFFNVLARQDEWFYLVFLDHDLAVDDQSNRTEMEQDLIDDYRWVHPDQMRALIDHAAVFPKALPELTARWWQGWDGHCPTLREGE